MLIALLWPSQEHCPSLSAAWWHTSVKRHSTEHWTCLMCVCGTGKEDNEHFLLHCPLYGILRQDLFDQLSDIDGLNAADVNPKELSRLLLFGDRNLGTVAYRIILEAIISFIKGHGNIRLMSKYSSSTPFFFFRSKLFFDDATLS